MGLIADAIKAVLPSRTHAVGATIPTWDHGVPQYQRDPYLHLARAYSQNELVFAAIEELCSSAAEPCLAAYRKGGEEPEKLTDSKVLDLFERPNPFSSRFDLVAGIILFLQISGNVFIEKVRSRAGNVVELWLLRPDRVRVIPDRDRFISGYLYQLGDQQFTLPAADVIHIRTRNPGADGRSDYYGMPPLAVCMPRVEADVAMRSFTGAFFRNAGVPAGLLTLQKQVTDTERNMIRTRFRGETGGVNAYSLLVLDGTEATFSPMGMPLGQRGLVMPELDEIFEARIAMPFGVPLELIGARLGMIHGNRSTMREARAGFWDETLAPMYVMLANALTNGLAADFEGDWDYLEFDTSTVKALAEDADALWARIREGLLAGLITREEAREALGYDPEAPLDATWILGRGLTEVPPGTVGAAPKPPQAETPAELSAAEQAAQDAAAAAQAGSKLGRPIYVTPDDIRRAKAWVASLDVPVLDEALKGKRNGKH